MLRAAAFAVAFCLACAASVRAEAPAPAAGVSPAATAAGASAVESARRQVAAGDLPGAVSGLTAYLAEHPKDLEAARYLGDLYFRGSDFAAAERTYLAILQADPSDRATRVRLGRIYASQNRTNDAIEQFQLSLPDTGALAALVELHRRLGDLGEFEAQYRAAVIDNASDAGALYAYGTVLHAERKNTEAVGYLQRALRLSPGSCAVQVELGATYLDTGSTDDAVAVLRDCLRENPNDYAALVNLSDAYDPALDENQIRPLLERALRERPDRPEALVDLGYLEDAGGRWENAIAYYHKALAVDPLWRDAYVNLGFDYEQHQFFRLSEATLLKGLSVSPDDGRLHFLLGVTYSMEGKRELARGEFARAAGSDEPDVAREATRKLANLN